MDVNFCDLCNESVPQSDLDAGRAVMRRGRVVCARCDSAMSAAGLHQEGHGAPAFLSAAAAASPTSPALASSAPSAAPQPGAAIAVALASVAILAALCVSLYCFDGLRAAEDARSRDAIESSARVERAERAVGARIDAGFAEMRSAAEDLRGDLVDMRARAEELRGAHDARATSAAAEIQALEESLGELSSQMGQIERLGKDLEELRVERSGLAVSLAEFEGRLSSAEAARMAVPEPIPSQIVEEPSWKLLLPGLSSPSPSRRWEAVQALGTSGDPAVAEFLAPMLKDPDIFVRMATARFLGDLHAVLGVPALIDALEDVESSVRETAYIALRAITGQDIEFDPIAKDSERARRVKAWRDWWDENAAELLGAAREMSTRARGASSF